MRHIKFMKSAILAVGLLASAVLPSSSVWAHGGAGATTTDTCRVAVGKYWVHFTSYLPMLTGTEEYCTDIPSPGMANLVFDYEGKALRNMTVEFEITKEPEGTRIHYQAPNTYPRGTVNAQVNLGPGKYLAHVTLVNEGQKIDSHLPFVVATGNEGATNQMLFVIGVIALAALYILYLSSPAFKGIVDRMMGKAKEF
jgi:hypothetical protein